MNTRTCLAASALLVTALGCREDVGSPTQPAPTAPRTTVMTEGALAFRQLSAGRRYTWSVTTDDQAYCWGYNFPGILGNGSQGNEVCATFDECVTQPGAVVRGLRFRNVSAGTEQACGVTAEYRAYCSGNDVNQVGHVAGSFDVADARACLWDRARVVQLSMLPDGDRSEARALNKRG